MGDELDEAEARGYSDMAYCMKCGGFDLDCAEPGHTEHPQANPYKGILEVTSTTWQGNALAAASDDTR